MRPLLPAKMPRVTGLFYGWYIALAGAASNFLILGVAIFGFSVFIDPIQEEMGWSLAAISLGFSLRSFEQGLLSPVTGLMVDYLGARRMALLGVAVVSAGLVLFSQAYELWVYYAASLLIAFGQSLGSFTPFSAALMNWFQRRRGQAIGLLNAGNGAGYFMAPVLALLITLIGWRSTLIVAAAVILVLGLPLAMMLRDRPEPYGYRPDGDAPPAGQEEDDPLATPSASGMTVRDALQTPAFYLLAIATAVSGATVVAWIVHQVPHLQNGGFSLSTAALIGGGYGALQIGLRYVCGWAGDLFGRRRLYISAFIFQGLGLLAFAYVTADRLWLVPVYYVTYGFGHATWLALQMTMVADYFGTRRFATLRGLAQAVQTPLGVLTPVLAGAVFDQTGTYRVIFTVYAGVAALGAVAVLLIRRPTWEAPALPTPSPEAALPTAGRHAAP